MSSSEAKRGFKLRPNAVQGPSSAFNSWVVSEPALLMCGTVARRWLGPGSVMLTHSAVEMLSRHGAATASGGATRLKSSVHLPHFLFVCLFFKEEPHLKYAHVHPPADLRPECGDKGHGSQPCRLLCGFRASVSPSIKWG